MSIESINLWHSRARPTPDAAQFNTQLGCHFEEFAEMCKTLEFKTELGTAVRIGRLFEQIEELAVLLKTNALPVRVTNRKEFLDAIADQVVAGVGAAYCAGMDAPEAVRRVDSSNWSKYVDGQPVFDENGKIAKGPYYKPVDLTGTY